MKPLIEYRSILVNGIKVCVYVCVSIYLYIYSQHPVTRTLRGNQNLFEIANIRVNETEFIV